LLHHFENKLRDQLKHEQPAQAEQRCSTHRQSQVAFSRLPLSAVGRFKLARRQTRATKQT
jgi:hypothetical protein